MSWEATSAVIKKSNQKGSARLMMLVIANPADKFGWAWPGVKTIAADTRLSERNIQYLEAKAVRSGELEIFENAGPVIQFGPRKGQRTNLFHITLCGPTPPGHPYFGLEKRFRKGCKDFTTKVAQKSEMGGATQCGQGGEGAVKSISPDPLSGERSSGSVRTVDKSTSSRNQPGAGRKCTHGNCGSGPCTYPGGADIRTLARIDFNRELEQLEMRGAIRASAKKQKIA